MTMVSRAYSLLNVKSFDDDQRVIKGVATSPTPDRMGDVVEPLGVKFSNPLPLLHQHNSAEPVGHVVFDKPTKNGITFTARLPKIDEPGPLKDRVDLAWSEVKYGLVPAVSIGFKPIEYSHLETGGIHFLESEVIELSLVTIPAQPEAVITSFKSLNAEAMAVIKKFDVNAPAATSIESTVVSKSTPPAPGKPLTKTVKAQEAKSKMSKKKTYAEMISEFEATKLAHESEIDAIIQASNDRGETLDVEEQEKCDALEAQVKQIDDHLVRLKAAEERSKRIAVPASGSTIDDASKSRSGTPVVQVRRNVDKGIIFTRLLGAKYAAYKSNGMVTPLDVARNKFGDTPEVESIIKAAVAAGSTTDSTWASPLVELTNATGEFIEMLSPATIIGRIPGFNRVDFNIKVPRGTGDPTAYWVGEGAVKPLSALAFDSVELLFNKVAGIVPMTEELMRFSNPSAERIVRDRLIAALTYLTDRDFLDPSKAEVTGVSPASVTNGVTPIAATGTTADALRADLGNLIAEYLEANMGVGGLVLVMTSAQAMRLSLMRNTLGQREFEGITLSGGTLEGIPVVTSENIVAMGGSPTDGYPIVAINAPEIFLAEGGVEVDVSREASLQMNDAPDSPETTSTILVSLWQRNMVAIRAERFITWKKARSGAVQYISYAKYSE